MRKKHLAGVLPAQSDDLVVEYVERKALSQVPFEIRLKEVIPPPEEIPGMVQLDAPQLGEFVLLILGAESVVGSGCCEDCSCTNSYRKLVVLDGVEDTSAEDSH